MKRLIVLLFLTVVTVLKIYTNGASIGTFSNVLVYIYVTCKVYHSTKDCRGLTTHKIKAVSLSEAQKTRRACKICY